MQLGTLTADELKVATLVGVTENYVARRAAGQSVRQVSVFFSSLFCYVCRK
jgi:hypothetical protein